MAPNELPTLARLKRLDGPDWWRRDFTVGGGADRHLSAKLGVGHAGVFPDVPAAKGQVGASPPGIFGHLELGAKSSD